MAINRQDSRHRIKRTNLTGVVPTAHTASTDFTDGTWLNTDLREAEFFYNIPDRRLWIGTGTSSIEIAQIGSTTSGNSLEQTLSIGNNSGTNNIIMGTATTIKSLNGGGQIELDSISNGGGPGSIYLSTDSGGYAETGMFLEPGNGAYIYSYDGAVVLESNSSNISFIESGINSGQLRISTPWLSVNNDSIFIKDNQFMSVTSSNTYSKLPVSISSQNTSFSSGVANTVVLGGTGISAIQSNSVYVPDLRIQTGKSISFNYSTLTTDTVSTTTIGTFSIATITMVDDQSLSIRGQANGYCASPNRNMGATFFASFIKYGGTIFQNGTTDIVLKDGYGDGTTPRVWTDGTNIFISIRTFSILTSKFTTSYEILST